MLSMYKKKFIVLQAQRLTHAVLDIPQGAVDLEQRCKVLVAYNT